MTRNELRKGEISERERNRIRARVVVAADVDAVLEGAVAVVGAADVAVGVELPAPVPPHDSMSGFLLCPTVKGGNIRTPVQ